jgi:Ni/Co efflux regulator RcnB
MKRTLAALTALALFLPAIAAAQRPERDRSDQQDAPQAGPQATGPQGQRPAQNGPRGNDGGSLGRVTPNQAAPQAGPQAVGPQAQRPQQNERGNGGGLFSRAVPNQAAPNPREPEFAQDRDRREENRERRDENRERRDENRERRDENRERRELDRGPDFRGDRDRGDARRVFVYRGREYSAVRGPEFRYPRGWAYRRWYQGDVLPRLFLTDAFFIDYAFLGLPPPPRYYRWVRYGPDALLVNVYDGRVLDVVYDAYY